MPQRRATDGTIKSRFWQEWNVMTVYERFEQGVALILTWLIAIIIVVALVELSKEVIKTVVAGTLNPLDHRLFQTLFAQILTLLIALEFKHSILKVVARKESIIQVKTVLLIAMLAISRKFMILDLNDIQADTVFALAAAVVALAVAYWLIRQRDAANATT